MSSTFERSALFAAAALAALMGLTRFHHFGSSLNLPDASLAVFFLVGLVLAGRWFVPFVALAAAIDYAAIGWGGVSDYCVTPAYAFLLPTYAAMTFGGMWARRAAALGLADLPRMALAALLSTALAFVISNGSFYFFSGNFGGLGLSEYVARTAHYFLPYLGWALFYVAAGLVAIKGARALRAVHPTLD
jgi:hypothetical protein